LPLLVAMARGNESERRLIRTAIEHGEVTRLPEIVAAVRRTGAIDAARTLAREEAQTAGACAAQLPASIYKDALLHLSARAAERSS
jgi:octaprenyl-diphosphate synthase